MAPQPLVSVPVITYNSSKTVVETLDSIYNQTYPNLELIVSDDGSPDDTVEICRNWMDVHKERFVRTELLTVEKNTGVSANMNRAEAACRGEWVKPIAGDDVLLDNCIETYVDYVREHTDAVYVFAKVEAFGSESEKVNHFVNNIFDYSFFDLPMSEQYKWMITKSSQPIPAATTFYHLGKSLTLGIYNDERIPFLEDWPKWIRLLEKEIRFCFLNKALVKYRISNTSICCGTTYNKEFNKSLALLYLYYQYEPDKKYIGKLKAFYKYLYYKRIVADVWYWRLAYLIMWSLSSPKRLLKVLMNNK